MESVLERLGKSLSLTEEEEAGIVVPASVNERNTRADLVLVGRLLAFKGFNFNSFCNTIKSVINPRKGLEITKVNEDRMLFQFFHTVDKQRALAGCPWSFDKSILILHDVGDDDTPAKVCLDFCSFHVHIHNLPLARQTKEMAMSIGNRLGEFVDVDAPESIGVSMRIRVRINICLPLKRAMKVKGTHGEEMLVSFTYERLPNFCYLCGIIGHIEKDCMLHYEKGVPVAQTDLPYGPWLREKVGRFIPPHRVMMADKDQEKTSNTSFWSDGRSDQQRTWRQRKEGNEPEKENLNSNSADSAVGKILNIRETVGENFAQAVNTYFGEDVVATVAGNQNNLAGINSDIADPELLSKSQNQSQPSLQKTSCVTPSPVGQCSSHLPTDMGAQTAVETNFIGSTIVESQLACTKKNAISEVTRLTNSDTTMSERITPSSLLQTSVPNCKEPSMKHRKVSVKKKPSPSGCKQNSSQTEFLLGKRQGSHLEHEGRKAPKVGENQNSDDAMNIFLAATVMQSRPQQ